MLLSKIQKNEQYLPVLTAGRCDVLQIATIVVNLFLREKTVVVLMSLPLSRRRLLIFIYVTLGYTTVYQHSPAFGGS